MNASDYDFRADPAFCQFCPPDRMCPWACVQGAGVADILIEMKLAQDGLLDWPHCQPDPQADAALSALLDAYTL